MEAHEQAATGSGRGWAVVWVITVLALALRLAVIPVLGDATNFRVAEKQAAGVAARADAAFANGLPRESRREDAQGALVWDWGYEQAAVSLAVAEGRGFSDPFLKGTGATGWACPAYPLLVAGLIRATDGPTWSTALALGALQALASALICLFLFRLGRALHSPSLGIAAAALWALHPMASYLPVALVWDSTFVALGITWFLANLAESATTASPGRAAGLGLRFGVLLLVNPAPLALIPLVIAVLALGRGPRGAAVTAASFLGVAALVASPWAVRNAVQMGSPNLRTNLGVELFVGNNDEATGPFNGHLHPAYNAAEFAKYTELGEVDYSADCVRRAAEWAREHPSEFTALSLTRLQRFWVGPWPWEPVYLGMGNRHERDWQGWIKYASHALAGLFALLGALLWRGRERSAWIVRGALLLFPLLYYVTHVFERYRFPIEPIVTLSASFVVHAAWSRWRRRTP